MLKLLLKILLLPPGLLQVHAQGYADLAGQVCVGQWRVMRKRWLMYALSALSLLLALVLGGMALLLWSVTPMAGAPYPWVLLALPTGLLGVSALCWLWARHLHARPGLDKLKEQIRLDMQALGQAHTP